MPQFSADQGDAIIEVQMYQDAKTPKKLLWAADNQRTHFATILKRLSVNSWLTYTFIRYCVFTGTSTFVPNVLGEIPQTHVERDLHSIHCLEMHLEYSNSHNASKRKST